MKLILLILFSYISVYSQIKVIGDTTDLKTTYGSGVVLLEQYGKGDVTGGGFFHRIDSTYAEGTFAFDYPGGNGYQWARLNLVDYYLNFSSANYKVPVWITDRYTPLDICGLDSFYLANTLDTIRVAGVDTNCVFVFAEWTPLYDSDIDSVTYSYRCKTDTVFVTRTSTSSASGTAYKSNGKYSYMRLK